MGFERLFGSFSLVRSSCFLAGLRGGLHSSGKAGSSRHVHLFENATSISIGERRGIGQLYKLTCKPQCGPRLLSTFTAVAKDVVLFEHDRTMFFRMLTIFCAGQVIFWTYLAQFAFTSLRNTEDSSGRKVSTTGLAGFWSFEMNLGSIAWRYGFTIACLAIGGSIAGFSALFCRRSVSQVILHKGGKMVTVTTQSPLGANRGRRMTLPLTSVTCHAHRNESPSFIPLRVKDHKFYFLLDKEGRLNNPKLFDFTVGAFRTF